MTNRRQRHTARPPSGEPASSQLAAFIARFEPKNARLIRGVRRALRRRLPTAVELVYDNYNALAIGYASTERQSDVMVGLAATSRGVFLSFNHGAALPDPAHLLEGGGTRHRFLRLASAARLADEDVAALIDDAIDAAKTPLPAAGRGYTVIKSVSIRQRPRRRTAT